MLTLDLEYLRVKSITNLQYPSVQMEARLYRLHHGISS
jgi:hypothetical protein